jgi:methylthioribose-1-phosphate isomerase
MIAETVKWIGGTDGVLELIDQRRLPQEFTILTVRNAEQLHEAIRTLAVRGAPAIGVAAAYGPVLVLQSVAGVSPARAEGIHALSRGQDGRDTTEALRQVIAACDFLATSRPTAVNLFWALDRIRRRARQIAAEPQATAKKLHEGILAEAHAIYHEDVEMCRRIGENGEKYIADGSTILTHCNAGALATAGQGTALSVIFEAQKKGKRFQVYADETRPLLQGARLTAWELQHAGIDVTVICDNMAGWLMKQGKIDAVITGADRIAANGDTANKIGTYSVSVLAKQHGVPFYVAAPSSTFDLSIPDGSAIPIEERNPGEVTTFGGISIAPQGVAAYNPAFDVTEAQNIQAIITEKGVIEEPDAQRIREFFNR